MLCVIMCLCMRTCICVHACACVGQSDNVPVPSMKFCLEKMNASLKNLQDIINGEE